MNSAIYCRISHDDPRNESVSIHRQREELLALAKRNGDFISEHLIFIDDKSGGTLHREGLQKLLTLIKARQVKRLYIYELSRLTRGDLSEVEQLLKLVEEYNVDVIPIYGFIDVSTPETEMVTYNQALLNRYWRRRTSYALKRYRKHAKQSGLYHAHKSPLGLIRSGKFPNITWALTDDFPLVLEILDLYVNGKGANTIARLLNERGRTWKSGIDTRKPLNPDSVLNLINGVERYKDFLPPTLLTLVSEIRKERKDRQGNHKPKIHPPLLLRGLVKCAVCGTSYYTHHDPKSVTYEWSYYHANHHPPCGTPYKSAPAKIFDRQALAFAEIVLPQILNPHASADTLALPERDFGKEAEHLQGQLKNLARMLAANRISEAEYDELRREILAALNRLEQARAVPAKREDVNLLRDLLDEWGGVSIGFMIEAGAVDPEIANRVMRLLFESLPVHGRDMQTPVLKEPLRAFVTM